jgi:V/A-type H+-transporting ATPase subunit D
VRLRYPPGRSGRLWLDHRLELARRGADLLDKKRRVLAQEERRLRVLARQTAAAWEQDARDAETWLNRAAVMAGDEKLVLLAAQHPPAQLTIRLHSSMGVTFAAETDLDLGGEPQHPSGGSAAADLAVVAVRRAVGSAVRDAVAQSALKRVSVERALTARRQRAVEHRWLPALAGAAERLEQALGELEREEATRAVWVQKRIRPRR